MFLHLRHNMANNILVGDIGSTKSMWLRNFGTTARVEMRGFNPIAHSAADGIRLFVELEASLEGIKPDLIYYFGAGILDDTARDKVRVIATDFFPSASIQIESDMLGACKAACGNEAGTVAILGTGSNCAVYDGSQVIRKATTLGYLLGDEGSGSDIGKKLAQAYFYQTMPQPIRELLDPYFKNDRISFLHDLYTSSTPNQLLADCVKGIGDKQSDPWVATLVSHCFSSFIYTHLIPLQPVGPIHLIGSVGYIFSALIQHELIKAGLIPGSIIRDPVQQLFETLTHDTTA